MSSIVEMTSEHENSEAMARDEKIRELFATLLQVDVTEISDRATPATLDRWDSMQHLILVSGFEEDLEIDVDPEEAINMYESYAAFRKVVLQKLLDQR